jgi:hypothetical protein
MTQKEEQVAKAHTVKRDEDVVVKKSSEIPADILKKLLE